jgi:polyhydroxyalkanoate synthesis repressor PhaR
MRREGVWAARAVQCCAHWQCCARSCNIARAAYRIALQYGCAKSTISSSISKEPIMPANAAKTVIIKKYANRRLYNTETSSYITLDHLATMVREGRDFQVLDAKSNDDITRTVLTQIIVEEESRGQTMLPVNFLRQLISLYGDGLQSMVPQYLEASMQAFRQNQAQMQKTFGGAFGGAGLGAFEKIAEQNMAMMAAAAKLFTNNAASAATAAPEAGSSEIDDLKSQLAAMQAKVDQLGQK